MATATPSKHDRIERHIQRQRGAGVRNLASNFGFSFGLSSALPPFATTLESTHSLERPAKRRKSHDFGEKDALSATPSKTTSQDVILQDSSQSVRPTETYRLEDVEQEMGSGGTDEIPAVKTNTRRGRPRKDATDPAATHDTAGPVTQTTAKKRGRPKKVQVPVPTAQQATDTQLDAAVIAARVAMESALLDTGADKGSQDGGIQAKKRGRLKKKADDDDSGVLPVQTAHGSVARFLRPKRQAATTAMIKVSEGFLEEESDITKRRRDVTGPSKPPSDTIEGVKYLDVNPLVKPTTARGVKTIWKHASVNILSTSIGENNAGSSVQTRDRAAREIADDANMVATEIEPLVRPERRTAVAARTKVARGFVEEESDISKKRRDPDIFEHTCSETNLVDNVARKPPAIAQSLSAEPRTTAGNPKVSSTENQKRKHLKAKTAKFTPTVDTERLPLAEAAVNIWPRSPNKARAEADNTSTKSSVSQSKVNPTTERNTRPMAHDNMEKQKTAKILVEHGRDTVKAEPKSCLKPVDLLPETKPDRGFSASVAVKTASRAPEASNGAKVDRQVPRPLKAKQSRPCQQTKELADRKPESSEDLDWLFDKPAAGGGKPSTARSKGPAKKGRRIIEDMGDVDLDDLLSNIADFVPRGGLREQTRPSRGQPAKGA
ncbi:Putative AT hook, DNA-binding protein [Septoria linicola]|uniref:AT hook, DNA-binding protein n=1 Tax=Septoria linicola TaxID=215465 RepID=A0A9Q9ALP0_9PEZI|nr:putative AT hook, DNA-binding protein [Septoria linicola]USW48297.1 Putative AT hook, DNA-binding protein [Septoria linicola]